MRQFHRRVAVNAGQTGRRGSDVETSKDLTVTGILQQKMGRGPFGSGGCGGAKGGSGDTVSVPQPVRRIVSLTPSSPMAAKLAAHIPP
jgi:hypothetical protein